MSCARGEIPDDKEGQEKNTASKHLGNLARESGVRAWVPTFGDGVADVGTSRLIGDTSQEAQGKGVMATRSRRRARPLPMGSQNENRQSKPGVVYIIINWSVTLACA